MILARQGFKFEILNPRVDGLPRADRIADYRNGAAPGNDAEHSWSVDWTAAPQDRP